MVEELRYKPERHEFDSRWAMEFFFFNLSNGHYGLAGVDSASKSNEYQQIFLGGKAWPARKESAPVPTRLVGARACLDVAEEWTFLFLQGFKPQPSS
jgi:hypothetical protein